jgi:arylsulfatase A-like enzyme/Tfp pilus assembly protein PilF
VVIGAAVWGGWRVAGLFGRTAPPRNVLLITLDTTRPDYLGCYGRTTAQTPNIDRLAREGTLFSRCATCAPLTLPSHSSILTGVYPYVHGARQNGAGRLAPGNVTLTEVLKQAGFTTQATVAAFVLNRQFGTDQGFDVYHDVVPPAIGDPLGAERRGDEVCDDALKMLDSVAAQPHFFLWVHFYDPHHPYVSTRFPDPSSPNAYADEITFMDAQIGRLLDRLKQLGHERDTLVVAVSDHGEGLDQHEELMHGYLLYDTTVRAALLMRCPGAIPAAQTVAAQVRTIDIAPTILDLLGQPALEQAQGVSLVPLLTGRQKDPKLVGYSETFDAQIQYGLSQLRSLTAGEWKYILAPRPELYNLREDPGETHDLAADNPDLAAAMRTQLHQLLADAPPPPAPDESVATLDEASHRAIESLGYVDAGNAFTQRDVTELDRFEPKGGDPKDYVHYFRLLVRDLPDLQARQAHAQVEQLLRQLIQALPESARLHVQLAAVLHAQKRVDEATASFEEAVKLAPDDCDTRRKYATFLLRTQRPEDALQQFEWVLKKMPTDVYTLERCGEAYRDLTQFDQAETRLRRAQELDPKNARIRRLLGTVAEQRGRLAEAAQQYQAALDMDPDFKECRADLERVQQGMAP